ncbi:MAG: hypothetical protein ACXVA9_01180 [Bdellovibrionales bacterium]
MKRLSIFILILLAANCAPQHSGNLGISVDASTAPVTAQSLQSFQTTVYAFGQIQGCVKCHSTNVNPQWMNPNISTAYSFARTLLNVPDPGNSIFATYVANNHCNDPICADPNNIPVMQDLLAQWATVEVSQTSGGQTVTDGLPLSNPPYVTATLAIPASLPLVTATSPAVIRFDLSTMTPAVPALSNATLEVSIALYNSMGTTYKIYNPRLTGTSAAVTLAGVHVYIRPASGSGLGTEDINQGLTWSQSNLLVPAVATPSPLPTGPMTSVNALTTTSIGAAVQSAADVITIGFAGIQ